MLITKHPGIILDDIVQTLNGNQKTIGEHTRRLVLAGLVEKKYEGRMVRHDLTPYGRIFSNFIKTFSNT
jgi:predicted transcriptional regulator